MNKLESVILDQHRRVRAAGKNPAAALAASKDEIMAVATPELTVGILADPTMLDRTVLKRSIAVIRNVGNLADRDFLIEEQGYAGGILFSNGDAKVYGHSAAPYDIKPNDPIQEAMGDTPYAPMMWAKALPAEAYRNRPESQQHLSMAEYLAELGLTLGSMVTRRGDIVGATGFMPGPTLWKGVSGEPAILEHAASELIEPFRLSGLCDQMALDPAVSLDVAQFATGILRVPGNLN